MTRDDLIAALERAERNDPDLFFKAWALLKETPATTAVYRDSDAGRFHQLVFYGAFLEAARMLVPSGWGYSLTSAFRCDLRAGRASADVIDRQHGKPERVGICDDAATPAIAIAIAALKARPSPACSSAEAATLPMKASSSPRWNGCTASISSLS